MAKPRIFVSSTFYDLKNVRSDLERFIQEMGYEPVLHERGTVPYGKTEPPEKYCYQEIELCDIVVSIIGGKRGSSSSYDHYSISQKELKHALKCKKQVYIFIDNGVISEYRTYLANKENHDIHYHYVDSFEIYNFLDEIYALPSNNPITPFQSTLDIVSFLKAQWAGLFQRLLQEETKGEEVNMVAQLSENLHVVEQITEYLKAHENGQDKALKTILSTTHPVFSRIRALLNIPFRVYFTSIKELNALLLSQSFLPVDEENWDSPDVMEWGEDDSAGSFNLLKISKDIFDDKGQVVSIELSGWADDKVSLVPGGNVLQESTCYGNDSSSPPELSDGDIPF